MTYKKSYPGLLVLVTLVFSFAHPIPIYSDYLRQIKEFLTLDTLIQEERPRVSTHSSKKMNDRTEREQWVRGLVKAYPEISWFADAKVRITQEGGHIPPSYSWSKQIFKKHYPEFERCALRLWCLQCLLNGTQEDYEAFVADQPEEDKLSYASFTHLHQQIYELIHDHPWLPKEDVMHALEVALILEDLGKTTRANLLARKVKVDIVDNLDFYKGTLIECPEIYPSLKLLSYPSIQLLKRSVGPAIFSHILQLEGSYNLFNDLVNDRLIAKNPHDFEFSYAVAICHIAARNGHINNNGSTYLTQTQYHALQSMKTACLITQGGSAKEAYINYMERRSQWLGLTIHSAKDRVLTRIGAMLRLDTQESGSRLQIAFEQLDVKQQALVISQFDLREKDHLRKTPSYLPAVLINMYHNSALGKTKQERLNRIFVIALPIISEVLKEHRENIRLGEVNGDFRLNFNSIAKMVKKDPYLLNYIHFEVDKENHVITH